MKALKYEHQSILPLWGRVKLNLRDRYRKPNIVFNNSSCYQFFHQILKNCHFGVKKNHSSHIYMGRWVSGGNVDDSGGGWVVVMWVVVG